MKFVPGDNFRVTENGLTGTVVRLSFNSVFQEHEYVVKWDHLPTKEECYSASDADLIWEKISLPVGNCAVMQNPIYPSQVTVTPDPNNPSQFTVHAKVPIPHINVNITMDKISSYCDHEYVDIGFRHTKLVCKKCDREKL